MAIFTITPTGNFRYSDASCQNLLDCVQSGIPIEITPVTLMGLVAPVTLIEAAIFHTADVLAGLTMAQLIRPGSPVLFGGAPAAFHMRTATAPMAAIEAQQLNMAYVQIAKHLGLPTQAYMALSDSRVLDAQAGAETFSSAILAALAGINSVSGPGLLEYAMVFSLPKLVVDNELCGQALHFVRPSAVSPGADTVALARELLLEQHMMTAEHTLENWREHLFLAGPLIDRQSRDKWARGGSLSLEERALAEVETRLAAYEPIATDAAIVLEMRRVLLAGRDDQASLPETPR